MKVKRVYNTILLVNITLFFISLVRNSSFLITIKSCVREELSDIPFFPKTKLQQIIVEELVFGEFALATLTFGF